MYLKLRLFTSQVNKQRTHFQFELVRINFVLIRFLNKENHFHLIYSNDHVSKIMQSVKKYTAKEKIRNLKNEKKSDILKILKEIKPEYKITNEHLVYQESFYPQEITFTEMLKQKIEYIHYNPVRKKLVDNPVQWK